jgi:hypothetical protein
VYLVADPTSSAGSAVTIKSNVKELCLPIVHRSLVSLCNHYVPLMRNPYAFNCLIVVGANLCARDPLEVKGKGIRGVGGAADKEAYRLLSVLCPRKFLHF